MITPRLDSSADDRIRRLIDEGVGRASRRQRFRRRAVVLSAAAAVVAGGTGSVYLVAATHTEQTRSTYCYSSDSTESRFTQVGIPDESSNDSGERRAISSPEDRVATAIDLCGSAWRAGVLGDRTTPSAMTVCLRPDNVLAVFPRIDDITVSRDDFCHRLGLGLPE